MSPEAPKVMAFHQGAAYTECLARLHKVLEPRSTAILDDRAALRAARFP